ncbi:MAG: HalOD1 output domain-containing protein [Halobacteriaceae archaeon]
MISTAHGSGDGTATGRVAFDFDGGPRPSTAVVEAVGARSGREPTDLGPLAETIDPDALDDLFAPDGARRRDDRECTFRFGGYAVRVRGADGSGVVTVSD